MARDLLDCLLRQILAEGVFHADPHPGNLMLLDDGTLGLLDFGSVGRLDASARAALQRFLLAMNRQDPLAVTDALLEVVPRPEDIDEPALERALGQFMAKHLGPGLDSVRMFTDLFKIVSSYGLSIPPEVAAVFRALATLEGTLVRLSPGFDLMSEARAFALPLPVRAVRRRQPQGGGRARAGRPAADAAPPAAARGAHRQRRRARQARPQRPAAGRRARPWLPDRAAAPGAAHRARRDRRVDGRHPARRRRRAGGQRGARHDAVPAHRLQPAGDQRRARAARADSDLPPPPRDTPAKRTSS
ncbi:AarF/UbiB family protein [Nonomuraea ferruginea]